VRVTTFWSHFSFRPIGFEAVAAVCSTDSTEADDSTLFSTETSAKAAAHCDAQYVDAECEPDNSDAPDDGDDESDGSSIEVLSRADVE